jgi:WD40 repeat protein
MMGPKKRSTIRKELRQSLRENGKAYGSGPGRVAGGVALTLVLIGCGGPTVSPKTWTNDTGEATGEPTAPLYAFAVSPNGKVAASGGEGGMIRVWDVESGKVARTIKAHERAVMSLAFAPDGRTLASGGADETVKLWDYHDKANLATITGFEWQVNALAFSADGKLLAAGALGPGRRALGAVRMWDVDRRKMQKRLDASFGEVWTVSFSPDGQRLAAGGDGGVSLWNLKMGKRQVIMEEEGALVKSIAFGDGGKLLIAGDILGRVVGWETDTGRPKVVWNAFHRGPTYVEFCRQAKLAVAAGFTDEEMTGGRIKVYDVAKGSETASLDVPPFESRFLGVVAKEDILVSMNRTSLVMRSLPTLAARKNRSAKDKSQ